MNELRFGIVWLAVVLCLIIAIWGLNRHELSEARPSAAENRSFRAANRIEMFGKTYYLPWQEMLWGWGLTVLIASLSWPLATEERSQRWLGCRESPAGLKAGRGPR